MAAGVAWGLIAGVAGTVAMDALWYRRYRAGGGTQGFIEWEFTESDEFEDAGAPAQIGERIAEGVGVELPERSAGVVNDVVHWTTGVGWGVAAAFATDGVSRPLSRFAIGSAFGVAAFGTAYGVLAPIGIYEPIWEYDRETLMDDLSAHAVFGLGVGAALALRRTAG